MTSDDIIRMARACQMPYYYQTGEVAGLDKLQQFAALVVAATQSTDIAELEHENRLMRARNERLQAEVERLEQEQTAAWTPVTKAMPKPMVRVLIYYKTSAGFGRRIRGEWIPAKTEEATAENENGEYDEESDTYWIPEGWYECIDNWDEYRSVLVHEGTVTHWMPLPPAPIVEEKPDAA